MQGPAECILSLKCFTGPFPLEAVRWASEHPQEITPYLLDSLKQADPSLNMLPIFAICLLAQFREHCAFYPMIQLARQDNADELLGDAIIEGLGRALASVSNGNAEPLQQLIEDPLADPFVRIAALDALGAMTHNKMLTRAWFSGYIGLLMSDTTKHKPSVIWNNIVSTATDFRFHEHMDIIRQLFQIQLADPDFETLQSIRHRIRRKRKDPREMLSYQLIHNTSAELSGWSCRFYQSSLPGPFGNTTIENQ